jgi:glycosyltransferase involved in cell wall biosynthesis
MISNFGPADGGRETWAYQFIPRLLEAEPNLELHVFGVRRASEPEETATLLEKVAPADRDRLRLHFAQTANSRLPASIAGAIALRRLIDTLPPKPIEYSIAVGSFVELAVVLSSRALRDRPKIAWLRTVWVDEKAAQIPRLLRASVASFETQVLRKADVIIANGEDTAAHYRRFGLAVRVIRNAVDYDRWARPVRGWGEGPLKVGYIGRLSAVKGIGEFVELARRWPPDDRSAEFHVVGFGPLEPLVREAGREECLSFHGTLANDRLPQFLEELDAAVALTFNSRDGGTTGVSNAILEQMAAGKVIIAWDHVGFTQILDGGTAYLVEQGSVAALCEAVRTILADPDAALQRARAAQRTAFQNGFDSHMGSFLSLVRNEL